MAAQPATVRLPDGGPTVSLSVHPAIKNKTVPQESDYGYGWKPVKTNLANVVKHISAGGAISVGFIRSDHRTTENFVSSDIIGLDFDNHTSVQDLLKDAFVRKHAFMVYATVSSTKEFPRSRALFKLDRTVTSADEYKHLVDVLLSKYNIKVDQQCKDPVRIFFGSTKRDKHVDLTRVLPVSVIQAEAAKRPMNLVKPSPKEDAASDLVRLLTSGSERGSRDNDALKLVGSLVNVATPDVVEAVLKLWYDQKVIDKADFPFTKVQDMVNRMSIKAAPIRSEVVGLIKNKQIDTPQPEAHTVNFLDFIGQEEEDITWAIDSWLPEHTTGLMVAPPGNFKTWLAMAMGMSVATGLPFCDKYSVKQGRVLVVQQEDSKHILRQRMKTIGAELVRQFMSTVDKSDLLNPNLFTFLTSPALDMYVSDTTLRLDNPKAMDNFRRLIDAARYDLIVIDPLYAMAETDDYMAKSAQKLVELKRMRDAFGTSFLVLHHTKKTTDAVNINRQDIWGSQLLNAWLEVGIQIRPTSVTDSKQVRVMRHFKSSGEVASEILKFDICTVPDDRRFRVDIKESIGNATVNNGEVDLIAMIKQNGPMKTNEMAAQAGVHPSTISRKLSQLVKRGDLVRSEDDKAYSIAGLDISF